MKPSDFYSDKFKTFNSQTDRTELSLMFLMELLESESTFLEVSDKQLIFPDVFTNFGTKLPMASNRPV